MLRTEGLWQFVQLLIAEGGGTVATSAFLWGIGGFVLGVVLVGATFALMGRVFKPPVGTVKYAWWVALIALLLAVPAGLGATAGLEGGLRGIEKAMLESEFGQEVVPVLGMIGAGVYGMIYYVDVESLTDAESDAQTLTDTVDADQFERFFDGTESLKTSRLTRRVSMAKTETLARLVRSMREELTREYPAFQEYPKLATAADWIVEQMVEGQVSQVESKFSPLERLTEGVEEAANRHGDPAEATVEELSEWVGLEIVVPTILHPVTQFVRGWQVTIGSFTFAIWGLGVVIRFAAGRVGRRREPVA